MVYFPPRQARKPLWRRAFKALCLIATCFVIGAYLWIVTVIALEIAP